MAPLGTGVATDAVDGGEECVRRCNAFADVKNTGVNDGGFQPAPQAFDRIIRGKNGEVCRGLSSQSARARASAPFLMRRAFRMLRRIREQKSSEIFASTQRCRFAA